MKTHPLTKFTEPDLPGNEQTIYKYLKDTNIQEDEILTWGNSGSLLEAYREMMNSNEEPEPLGESFIEFCANLPMGTTPRPYIKKKVLKVVPI